MQRIPMSKFAEYYMTINKSGKLVGVSYAYPPKELEVSEDFIDIMLTYDEYILLAKGARAGAFAIEKIETNLIHIKEKIKEAI